MKKSKPAAKSVAKAAAKSSSKAAPAGEAASAEAPELALVRHLAAIATEFDLAEVELDGSGRVRVVRRAAGGPVSYAAPAPSHAPGPAHAPAGTPAAEAPAVDGILITSPFVGTFYRAPSPEAPTFIEVGQAVRKGQVVCIIEAMKLMNEIESEVEGTVVEILVKNAEHVEYGQPLFKLRKA